MKAAAAEFDDGQMRGALTAVDLSEIPHRNKAKLARQLYESLRSDLLRDGLLLIRGLEMDHAGLGRFAAEFSDRELFDYAGGVSPRVNLGRGVYSSTEYPPELRLSLHNEMSYSERFPRHLFFYCSIEPSMGGETTYGDSRNILAKLRPETIERFKRLGVRYDRHLSGQTGGGYSWQEAFVTESRTAVESRCADAGATCEWYADGSVRISEVRPATTVHPETGEEVWFNQAEGFHADEYNGSDPADPRLDSQYGDGTDIGQDVLDELRGVVRAETYTHRWRQGDLLILDNILAAHGRAPFTGPRRILLSMT